MAATHSYTEPCPACAGRAHDVGSRASVDNSAWDGSAALSTCANSDTPATCYGAICAGKKAGDSSKQSSWALPHHKTAGGPPNAAGVRNALARLSQTDGLTNEAEARSHLEAHLSAIGSSENSSRPPRDNLVRGLWPFELRASSKEGGMPVMEGHFAVFDRWTEIDSFWEGRFLESLARGAFAKTFQENRQNIKVLFQHGRDASIGNKPLGPIEELEEDDKGGRYAVPLLDTSYNRDLLPGLEAGLYGASFRFRVVKETVNQKPDRSDANPEGIPERVIQEAQVMEFGPVTFPAYADATAGIRSLTDDFILQQFGQDPERLHRLLHRMPSALPDHGAEPTHSDEGSRDQRLVVVRNPNRRQPLP